MPCSTINDIEFIPLKPCFLPQVLEIEHQVQTSQWSAEAFLSCFTNDLYRITGVFRNNQLLGYAVLMIYPPEAELHALAIDRSFQNRGIGGIFIRYLINKSSELKVSRIYLEVRESNAVAIRLYKNSGFIQSGARDDYYQAHTQSESALLFRLDICGRAQLRETKN